MCSSDLTEAQKRQYLPRVLSGETVCALAITEPGAGSDMAALATRAERRGDHYVLTGRKIFITNGVHGDLYFVRPARGRPRPRAATTGSRCSWSSAGFPDSR